MNYFYKIHSRWQHLCFLYDHDNRVISSYIDGVLNYEDNYFIGAPAYGDLVWLGQGARVSVDETSLSGEITQVIKNINIFQSLSFQILHNICKKHQLL